MAEPVQIEGPSKERKIAENFILPALSVLETILTSKASKGQNVTTSARDLLKGVQGQNEADRSAQERALDRALRTKQVDAQIATTAQTAADKKTKADEAKSAKREAIKRQYQSQGDLSFIMEAPPEQQKDLIKNFILQGGAEPLGKTVQKQLSTEVAPKSDLAVLADTLFQRDEFQQKKEVRAEGRKVSAEERAEARKIEAEGRAVKKEKIKLTGPEKAGLGAVQPAVNDLNALVEVFVGEDLGGKENVVKGGLAKVPLLGKFIVPDASKFNASKKIVSEGFLRAATGAAAPAEEVDTYAGFLPDVGDPVDLAQTKLENFKRKVKAKAITSVSRFRAEGLHAEADKIEAEVDAMLAKVKNIVEPQAEEDVAGPQDTPSMIQLKERARAGDQEAIQFLNSQGATF